MKTGKYITRTVVTRDLNKDTKTLLGKVSSQRQVEVAMWQWLLGFGEKGGY